MSIEILKLSHNFQKINFYIEIYTLLWYTILMKTDYSTVFLIYFSRSDK